MNTILENLKSGKYQVVDNQGVSVTNHFIECLQNEFIQAGSEIEPKVAEKEYNNACQHYEYQLSELNKEIYRLQQREKILEQQIAEKNKDIPDTIIMASRQNGKSKLVQLKFKKILNDYAINELQELLNKVQTIDVLHQSGHYINQKKVNVIFKQHIENQIKQLEERK